MMGDDLMVLAQDTTVIASADLPSGVRRRLGSSALGGYVVSRVSSRSPSLLLDGQAAGFLATFQMPRTIVSGVLAHSRASGRDPHAVLEAAYPILERLIRRGFLVAADSAGAITPRLVVGDTLDGFVVDHTVQVFAESEVHFCHDGLGEAVALKLARLGAPPDVDAMLHREARLLRQLDGVLAPALVAVGAIDGRPYLVSRWSPGISVTEAATLDRVAGSDSAHRLRALCLAVVEAYARLHRLGVLHGDVHPGNVLFDRDTGVTLLDFGLAHPITTDPDFDLPPRRGVGFSFEPEYARARRLGLGPVAATPAGEQYAVAALVYLLLTGMPYADFRLDEALWQQIEETPPLSFADRGVPPWPAGETVLARALSKAPGDRFSSTTEFARSFERACGDRGGASAAGVARTSSAATALLAAAIRRLDVDPGRVPLARPTCSAQSGAGGIAFMFYRLACVREDPALLARADSWAQYAVAQACATGAFAPAPAVGAGPAPGTRSIHHAQAGPLYVSALVSLAQGDTSSAEAAVCAFCDIVAQPSTAADVTFGASGALLACANLNGALQGVAPAARIRLVAVGDELHESVLATDSMEWLGAAHGWAGLLYASLCWTQATGGQPHAGLEAHLDLLRSQATVAGRCAWWPRRPGPADPKRPPATGWCHGSAGHAHLWSTASAVFQDDSYLDLAERAARHAAGSASRPGGSLCCGWAGQAYACLALSRRTGDPAWHRRARGLADRAAGWALRGALPNDLYSGDLGVALLAADIEDPANARMPLFEPDGWPSP